MSIKTFLPASLRLHLRVFLRKCRDIVSGDFRKFAKRRKDKINFPYKISLTQPIKKTAHFENKVHNIGEGAKKVSEIIILPNEIFSFWQIVKKPDIKNNYRIGRNLISGKLSEDYGGGLCQVSSIIYHISILGGLVIQERHNHSIDIYEEQDRFTPLGADAAVVFGYKDLKIKNPYSFPVKFSFEIKEDFSLVCELLSKEKITSQKIIFEREKKDKCVLVHTKLIDNDKQQLLTQSVYKGNTGC